MFLRKLHGFTIIELIVVLIISSISITLCIKVYSNFNGYFIKTLREQDAVNKVMWFSLRMKEDINKADYITGNSETIKLYCSDQKSVYEFYPDKIIMQKDQYQITDTLLINLGVVHLAFITPGIVNFIEFDYTYNSHLFKFCQNKEYSIRFLFDNIKVETP